MRLKGVNYDVGIKTAGFMSRPVFDAAAASRELEIIKHDLHCNAVRISGTDPDRMMTAAEIALKLDLEVWLSPHLHDRDELDTLAYTADCAERAERLRLLYHNLTFILGCELTLFMQGILPGDSIFERVEGPAFMESIKSGAHNKPLQAFLAKANEAVRRVFHGKVAYASAPLETVDWSFFDYVCLDHYREVRNKPHYAAQLKRYSASGKPIVITEFGCCTYRGAEDAGGRGWMIVDRSSQAERRLNGIYIRDENVQARELAELLTILDEAGVEGAFAYTFVSPVLVHREDPLYDLDMASYALVTSYEDRHGITYPDMTWEPKESFKTVARFYLEN